MPADVTPEAWSAVREANRRLGRAIAEKAVLIAGGVPVPMCLVDQLEREANVFLSDVRATTGWSDIMMAAIRDDIAKAFAARVAELEGTGPAGNA